MKLKDSKQNYHIILCPGINIMFVQNLKGNRDNVLGRHQVLLNGRGGSFLGKKMLNSWKENPGLSKTPLNSSASLHKEVEKDFLMD